MEEAGNKKRKLLRWGLIIMATAVVLYAAYRIKVSFDQDAAISAAQNEEHFIEGDTSFYDLGGAGYTLLTPTILPPTSANGRVRNETWIRFPDNGVITTYLAHQGQGISVKVPPGTQIERLTWLRESGPLQMFGEWSFPMITPGPFTFNARKQRISRQTSLDSSGTNPTAKRPTVPSLIFEP